MVLEFFIVIFVCVVFTRNQRQRVGATEEVVFVRYSKGGGEVEYSVVIYPDFV